MEAGDITLLELYNTIVEALDGSKILMQPHGNNRRTSLLGPSVACLLYRRCKMKFALTSLIIFGVSTDLITIRGFPD